MTLPVYARAGDLSRLLDYFLDRVLLTSGDIPLPQQKLVPPQLELAVKQDDGKDSDFSIRIYDEGKWHETLPSWYTPEIRRQQGFTPDYLQQISTEA